MGKILQKKKSRSGLAKARSKTGNRLKSGNKKINVLGNAIIAENWYADSTKVENMQPLNFSVY